MGDRRQIGRVAHPGGERAGQRQGRVRGDQQRHEDENPMGAACHGGRIVSHRSGNVTGSTVERVPLRPMTREMPPGLEIRVLGPLEVLVDGAPLVGDTRKALATLVLLGGERRAFARDELAALLWPEADDESARGALRRTLSVLRAALGDRWLRGGRAAGGAGAAGARGRPGRRGGRRIRGRWPGPRPRSPCRPRRRRRAGCPTSAGTWSSPPFWARTRRRRRMGV